MRGFAREPLLSADQPPTRMFVWPFEMMLRFQANVANAIQETTVSWAQRRREAAQDVVETFERLVHCRDIGEAVSIQQEWLENNLRRLDEDFDALAHQGANLSHRAAASAREAVGQSSDAARAGARQAEQVGESVRRQGEEAQKSQQEGARQETEEATRHGRARDHGKRAA